MITVIRNNLSSYVEIGYCIWCAKNRSVRYSYNCDGYVCCRCNLVTTGEQENKIKRQKFNIEKFIQEQLIQVRSQVYFKIQLENERKKKVYEITSY